MSYLWLLKYTLSIFVWILVKVIVEMRLLMELKFITLKESYDFAMDWDWAHLPWPLLFKEKPKWLAQG